MSNEYVQVCPESGGPYMSGCFLPLEISICLRGEHLLPKTIDCYQKDGMNIVYIL